MLKQLFPVRFMLTEKRVSKQQEIGIEMFGLEFFAFLTCLKKKKKEIHKASLTH